MQLADLFRIDKQVVLVTGGGNGIGAMAADVLAQAGGHVVVADIELESAQALVASIQQNGASAEAASLDVTDERSASALLAHIDSQHGRLDVLVNSAGAAKRMATVETPLDVWNHVLAVNLTGTFLMCREAAKLMLKQARGSIINLASIMGHSGGGLYPNSSYHASKGGVVNLTRALAAEWGADGIRVNDIAPTFVNTRFAAAVLEDAPLRSAIEQLTPLGRIAETKDLAGAILYLASPASALVTGHSLAVDGGFLAR